MVNKSQEKATGLLVSVVAGCVAGLIATLIHRIGINAFLPYGFILATLFLFASAATIRAYISRFGVYAFSLACTLTTYFLATALHGDVLIVASTIPGEKPWVGLLGWTLLVGSFFVPFIVVLLPDKFFSSYKYPPTWNTHDKDLDFMLRLVTATDIILTRAFLSGKYQTSVKHDGTPVTEVDKAVEAYIRDRITKEFPRDDVLGEEFADTQKDVISVNDAQTDKVTAIDETQNVTSTKQRRWIVDPIDGTKNFIRGVPVFATLIALEEMQSDGTCKVVKSVVSAPLLKRRWWGHSPASTKNAEKSSRASAWSQFDQNKPHKIHVSDVSNLANATLSISSRGGWVADSSADQSDLDDKLQWFDTLCSNVKRVRGFGDFYSYMLLAEGGVDIATEPSLELYDIAALIPIVEGAGGTITDIYGSSWNSRSGIMSALAHAGALKLDLLELH